MAEESVSSMLTALTDVLKGLNVQQLPPPVKLCKFKGPPREAGDLSLTEWLDEFTSYSSHYKLSEETKAQTLLDNLGGVAKEEILCRDESIRKDSDEIAKVLKALFAPAESVSSLTQAFHNRYQFEGETLADFSRSLMRLYT